MLDPIQNPIPEEEIIPANKFDLDDFFHTKSFKIGVMVIFGILFLLIVASAFYYFLNINNGNGTPTPTPSISVISPRPTKIPSKYATDSGLLKEQNNLDTLENDLKNLDLNEKTLTFPEVDFNISFDKSDF